MSPNPDKLPFDPRKSPDPDFVAPDLIGALEGWRSWSVATTPPPYGVPPKLYSVTYGGYYWIPRQAAEAECERCSAEDGEGVPGENDSCGFYSAKSLEHLLKMSYHQYDGEQGNFHVIGQVANWGKVVEGSQGWRAQFSYPVMLYLPFEAHKLLKGLKAGYGVPVKLHNFLKPVSAQGI